jgi:hypothetical protein
MELEMKINCGGQLMTQKKNISDGLPHLEKEFIGEYCRSRYPLPKPSKRCKDHMRDGE